MVILKFELSNQYDFEIVNGMYDEIDDMYPTDWCEVFLLDIINDTKLNVINTTLIDMLLSLGFTIAKIIDGRQELDTCIPFTIGEKYNASDLEVKLGYSKFHDVYALQKALSDKYGLNMGNKYHVWLYSKGDEVYFEVLKFINVNDDDSVEKHTMSTPIYFNINKDNLLPIMKYFNYYHMKISDNKIIFSEYGLPDFLNKFSS